MKTIIIALLFRVTTGKRTLQDKIDYILFVVEDLLVNPAFQAADDLLLINALKTAATTAAAAAAKAESKATADIRDKQKAERDLNKAYKKVAIRAEEICDEDVDAAIDTGLVMRKRPAKKNPEQPRDVRASAGKQEGDVDAKCKSQGTGITYLRQIRKVGDKDIAMRETTTKAAVTFTGLVSGEQYEIRVAARTSSGRSEPSDVAVCRAR